MASPLPIPPPFPMPLSLVASSSQLIKPRFRASFLSLETSSQKSMNAFIHGRNDHGKMLIFGDNLLKWASIKDDVKVWLNDTLPLIIEEVRECEFRSDELRNVHVTSMSKADTSVRNGAARSEAKRRAGKARRSQRFVAALLAPLVLLQLFRSF